MIKSGGPVPEAVQVDSLAAILESATALASALGEPKRLATTLAEVRAATKEYKDVVATYTSQTADLAQREEVLAKALSEQTAKQAALLAGELDLGARKKDVAIRETALLDGEKALELAKQELADEVARKAVAAKQQDSTLSAREAAISVAEKRLAEDQLKVSAKLARIELAAAQ